MCEVQEAQAVCSPGEHQGTCGLSATVRESVAQKGVQYRKPWQPHRAAAWADCCWLALRVDGLWPKWRVHVPKQDLGDVAEPASPKTSV